MNFKSLAILAKASVCCALFAIPLSSESGHASEVQPGPLSLNNSYIALPNFSSSYPDVTISSAGTQNLTSATSQIQSTVLGLPFPSLQVSGSTTGGEAVSILNLSYQFAIFGPTANVGVFVGASGSFGGSSTGPGGFLDGLQATVDLGGPGISISESVPGGTTPGSFTLNQKFTFQTNTLYDVQMIAEGGPPSIFSAARQAFSRKSTLSSRLIPLSQMPTNIPLYLVTGSATRRPSPNPPHGP
jgi:hypothetical protein